MTPKPIHQLAMFSSEKTRELSHLDIGDVVAFRISGAHGDALRWTLSSVQSFQLNTDLELRLWEKRREPLKESDIPNIPEAQELLIRLNHVKVETQTHIKAADLLIKQLRSSRVELMRLFEVVDAHVLKSKVAIEATCKDVEKIRDFNWNELKSYRTPPKAVLLVVRAVMLLLSEDEARTWVQMRRILQDGNFIHRIIYFDPERQLSPNRCDYILQECISRKGFNHEDVLKGSVALSPIYYWVLAHLDYRDALTQRDKVKQVNHDLLEEYLALLNNLNQEEVHIAELQATEEKLYCQLRFCLLNSTSNPNDEKTHHHHSSDDIATHRYENSFAGKSKRAYLLPAFYRWEPTDRVTFIPWENFLVDFGSPLSRVGAGEDYFLSEFQIGALDVALTTGLHKSITPDHNSQPALKGSVSLSRHSTKFTDRFQRRIKGKRWKDIITRRRNDIEQALREDTASCLELSTESITVVDLRLGSLIADLDILHDRSQKREAIQKRINSFDYQALMKIYEDEKEATGVEEGLSSNLQIKDDPPRNQVGFAGELWGELLLKYPTSLMSSFLKDISDATAVEQDKFEILDIHCDEEDHLIVCYIITDYNIDAAEVDRACKACAFHYTWELYRRHSDIRKRASAVLSSPEISLALNANKDTSTMHHSQDVTIEMERLQGKDRINSLQESEHPLSLNDNMMISDGIVDPVSSLETSSYPTATYNGSDTIYVKNFEGQYWRAALNTASSAFTKAFRTDTASALGISPREIKIHEFTHMSDRLQARFSVSAHGISPQSVWSTINTFEYPEVWALYNQFVYRQETSVRQFTQIFNGEDWPAVLVSRKTEFEEAFVRDVGDAMGPSPVAVTVRDVSAETQCAVVHYEVTLEGVFARDVDDVLRDYPFPNVWAWYHHLRKNLVREPNAQGGSAVLRERDRLVHFFEGETWGDIVMRYRSKVKAAFKADKAVCLTAKVGNILIHSIETTVDGVNIVYSLKGVKRTRLEVEKKSEAYDYPKMWALYETSWVVTHHRVVFEGEGWGSVLEGREPQFEAVFAACTAKLFDLKTQHVLNTEFIIGSLIVKFDLNHLHSLTTEEIDQKLMKCQYDPLWAIYREHVSSSTEQLVATTHTLGFEGEHWNEVVNDQGSKLHEALYLDSSEALGFPRENIDDMQMDLTNGMLKVQLTMYHPASQTESDIDHMLSLWGYERVWSLYMVVFPNSTEQLPPVLPPAAFNTVHLQTSSLTRHLKGEFRSISCLNRIGVGEVAYVSGGVLYIRSINSPQSNCAWCSRTDNSLIEPWNQYCNSSSLKPQSHIESKANGEVFTTATVGNFRARSGVVGVTQRDFGSTVCDVRNSDKLICSFEDTNWNIWLNGSASSSQTSLFIDLTIIFQGNGWDYVIRNRYTFLKNFLSEEVARALGSIPNNAICEVNFVMNEDQDMIVWFRLPKVAVADFSESNIQIRLNTYPYRKVWSLYNMTPTAEAMVNANDSLMSTPIISTHHIGFEASNWEFIDWLRHDEIVDVARQDTARAVHLQLDDVDVGDVGLHPNLLSIRLQLRHSARVSSAELNERILQHDYAAIWRLYDEVPEGGWESMVHVKVFEGDQWGPVVASNGGSLAEAFRTGISRCLQIPRACITVANLTVGSLVIEYTVRSTLSDAAIRERTAAYSHPEVWSFYGYSHGENAVSLDLGLAGDSNNLQHIFKGKNWGVLVCRRWNTLQNLFVQKTSHILRVPSHQIQVTSLYSINDSLVMNYRVNLTSISEISADKRLNQAEYHELWSLYRFHDCENFVKTAHGIHLKGKNWCFLLERNFQLIVNTFALCTIWTLGLERWNIDDLRVELKPHSNCLEFSFTLWHLATLSASTIDRLLKKHAYNEVWALYECNPADRIRTSLSVLFSGPFWRDTPGARWPELHQAFAKDVANALGIPRTEVMETHMERVKDGIQFSAHVMHSPVLNARLLQGVLDRNDFPEIYFIHTQCHRPDHVDYVASNHRVDFEADQWREVLKFCREQAFNALRIDASAALNLALEDVDILFMDTIESRLSCVVAITHPATQTTREIQGKLNEFYYTFIWALYEDAVQPRVDVLKTHFTNSTPTGLVGRMGDQMPSQDFIHLVRNAFIEDTSIALKCAPNEIVIDGIQLGKLMVHYHVAGDEKTREVAVHMKNYQYPSLSALLKSHEFPAINAPSMQMSN
ncbi:unnamed protein product [Phytomonas sp. Hart1]|nr:unnamed protein product [Phytomonas sp. Hart1]|eukprot:CCW70716.1 unnamed protein product [Phytomonas sp. isolate Hart1]